MKISPIATLAATIAVAPTALFAFAPVPTTTSRTSTSQSQLYQAIDDKTEVREYFNNEGFNRWNKIYSESDEVNNVQLDIRNGHDQTIQKILNWIKDDGDISGKTVCDCGCGVGSLAIPLAQMGKLVSCMYVVIRIALWLLCCCLLCASYNVLRAAVLLMYISYEMYISLSFYICLSLPIPYHNII